MKRWFIPIMVLTLLLPIFSACGDSNPQTTSVTTTPAATSTPISTSTSTVAPSPVKSGPVKIGGIQPWSGPVAMSGLAMADPIIKLVEWQVKEQGGILGGRELSVIRYDNRASVPESRAGALKLYYDDNVSALVWGGISIPEFDAVAQAAEELQILYVSIAAINNLAEKKFSVNATATVETNRQLVIKIINKLLKAERVAFLGADFQDSRTNWGAVKQGVEAAGVKVVYEGYAPMDTTDYSAYLTRLKYAEPDVVYLYASANEFYITVAKQMMELGGWGDTKVVATSAGEAAKKQPGAKGWYMFATWAPGVDYPGATKFFSDYQTVNGKQPNASQIYYYNGLWTAIYAMELAGTDTDRVAIAQAARSGKLEWDTPMGHAHFMPDGTSGLGYVTERVQDDGSLVYVPLPE